MQNKKICVTGSRGFIGSFLCQYLTATGYQVIAYDQKIQVNQINKFSELLKTHLPEFVIHCAGSSSVAQSFLTVEKDYEDNVRATELLLFSIAEDSPATKVVFLSSGAVYGQPKRMPIDEDTATHPISPYGFHKLIGELLCRKYNLLKQIPVTILRIFSVYGPGLKKQLLWDIYQKSMLNKKVILQGSGNEARDFIYIEDLAKIIRNILSSSKFNGNIINVASGNSVSIKTLARLMLDQIARNNSLEFNGLVKMGDPLQWNVKINPESLGISDWTPLEVGLKNYANWVRKNHE